MRAATSAAWPLSLALATVIETEFARAGSTLGTLLDSPPVYSGDVPQGVPLTLARVILGASQENGAGGTFTRVASTNAESIEIYTADLSKRTALLIFGELRALVHRVPLALSGYGTVRGSLELIISMLDPSREQYHASARYIAYSLNP